jgi:hypothetical protein
MLDGYKTYIAALAAFIVALGAALTQYTTNGLIDINAVVTAFIALALVFLRQGIKKAA